MTFCDECGARYTRYDRECPGCGAPTGVAKPLDPPKPEPKREPEKKGGVTDWLDDLEVLPIDVAAPKKEEKKEIPHAHLQTVRDASGARVEVVLDNGIDNRFPPPVDRAEEPARPEPPEEPSQRDTGWFMTPDDGSRTRERPRDVRRTDPTPRPEEPIRKKRSKDHWVERSHGLEWQKEEQMRFDAEDGYHGPDSIKHEVVTDDGATWNVPAGKKKKK